MHLLFHKRLTSLSFDECSDPPSGTGAVPQLFSRFECTLQTTALLPEYLEDKLFSPKTAHEPCWKKPGVIQVNELKMDHNSTALFKRSPFQITCIHCTEHSQLIVGSTMLDKNITEIPHHPPCS